MKKINIILILSLVASLTSCVIESYEKPPKTIIGLVVASNVTSSLATNASVADLARVVEMWRSASDQDKYKIEDKYFRNTKIREIGDTIHIVDLCKINTSRQSFADTHWEVLSHQAKRKVSLLSENKIKVESVFGDDVCDLTVECVDDGKEFLVTGNGVVKQQPHSSMIFSKLTYNIADPVKFVAQDVVHSPFWLFNDFTIPKGTVQITPYQGTTSVDRDNTTVMFFPDNSVEIQFRALKEVHNNMYWYPGFLR